MHAPKRRLSVVAFAIALCAAMTGLAIASPLQHGPLCRQYNKHWWYVRQSTPDSPGRNVCRQGRDPGIEPNAHDIRVSDTILKEIIANDTSAPPLQPVNQIQRPAAPVYESTTQRSSTLTEASGNGGAGGVAACIRHYENGGSYSVGATGDHTGAYQFDPEAWAEAWHGHPPTATAGEATPAEQDQGFAQLYAQRPSAWAAEAGKCF